MHDQLCSLRGRKAQTDLGPHTSRQRRTCVVRLSCVRSWLSLDPRSTINTYILPVPIPIRMRVIIAGVYRRQNINTPTVNVEPGNFSTGQPAGGYNPPWMLKSSIFILCGSRTPRPTRGALVHRRLVVQLLRVVTTRAAVVGGFGRARLCTERGLLSPGEDDTALSPDARPVSMLAFSSNYSYIWRRE